MALELPRRQFLGLTAGAAVFPAPRIACAQTYPSRLVRIVVDFAAGASSDIIARLIAQYLSERFGQQFIIENRPGAGTNIAAETVVRAAPDGYSLLWVTQTNASMRRFTASSISTSSRTSFRSQPFFGLPG
jgi:tripartite-type tricarboxylate transporter receptor subunit TctC